MNHFWSYLTEALGWSLVGFLTGFLAGATARDVNRIADAVNPTGDPMAETPTRRRRRLRPTGQFLIGVVVLLLAAMTVIQGVITNRETRRLTDCLNAFSNGMADAIEARSNASAQAQQALDQLISTITRFLPNPAPQEERVRAVQDYQTKRQQAKEEQRLHPYPPPPRECTRKGN